jgi:hypothetical protein
MLLAPRASSGDWASMWHGCCIQESAGEKSAKRERPCGGTRRGSGFALYQSYAPDWLQGGIGATDQPWMTE